MRVLKYFIVLLFVFSVFNSVFAEETRNYDQWYEEHNWLFTKDESRKWESLKSDKLKETLVRDFYRSRDPDSFTIKNEFELNYQLCLEQVRKDFPDQNDPRRYIYLLYGAPKTRRSFSNQLVVVSSPACPGIRIDQAEIWSYQFGAHNLEVIFAKIDPYKLQQLRDMPERNISPALIRSHRYEILYLGQNRYADPGAFLEDFFQSGFYLKSSSDIIDDLKKPIIERAKQFWKKNSQPKVKEKKYSHTWDTGFLMNEDQFDINLPEEMGISIWFIFNKDSLYDKKKKYRADMSLCCEIRDSQGRLVAYYQDDEIKYEFKNRQTYYYHFWGSVGTGNYKLIIELGDNLGDRKFETEIEVYDYSVLSGVKTSLWVGKAIKDPERIKGKTSYFSLPLSEGIFCPATSREYFGFDSELIALFSVSGFRANNYGISYVEVYLSFAKAIIKQNKFVATGEVYTYKLLPMEKNISCFQAWKKIKVQDLAKDLKLPGGYYRVRLIVKDAVANDSDTSEYPRTILIVSGIAK